MLDISKTPKEKFIQTIAPIPMEHIQSYFTDKEHVFLIDYSSSVLRGRAFLIYLSNLAVPCDIQFKPDVTKEEKFELMETFMSMRLLLKCPTLCITAAYICGALKGINELYNITKNPIFTREEVDEFITKNKNLLNRWRYVLDSLPVFAMASSKKYVGAFGHPGKYVKVIDDPLFVGNNFVNILNVPGFMEIYFSYPVKEMYWFTHQFQKPVYGKQTLFYYFANTVNPLMALLDIMGSVRYDTNEFIKGIEERDKKLREYE